MLGTNCIRKLYYSYNKVEEDFLPDAKSARIMALGNSIGDMLAETFRKSGVLVDYHEPGETADPTGKSKDQLEFPVRDKEIEINLGKIDAVTIIDGKLWLGEFKSINNNGFGKLIGPKPEHAVQGVIYLYLFNRLLKEGAFSHIEKLKDFTKAEGIIFLYINKDNSEVKEFELTEGDEIFKAVIMKMQGVKKCTQEGSLPEKTPEFCQTCPWRAKCEKNYKI
jgi:CRISPR/Cas system-associated exonuclease Cas4 (RecB family)